MIFSLTVLQISEYVMSLRPHEDPSMKLLSDSNTATSVIYTFMLYSKTQETGLHTSIQFKLKCLFLGKSMLKERRNNLKSRYHFPSKEFFCFLLKLLNEILE